MPVVIPDRHRSPRLAAALAGLLVAVASGCASTVPLPADRLALARAALERAEREDAARVAPDEFAAARDKLARAEASPRTREGAAEAARLADQAAADAALAEATARAARADRTVAEVDASLEALRQEARRPTTP